MIETRQYEVPEEIRDDHSIRSYRNYGSGTGVLTPYYSHFVRKPSELDDSVNHLYYGDWEDVTDEDQRKARLANKKDELADLVRKTRQLQAQIKKLEQDEAMDDDDFDEDDD